MKYRLLIVYDYYIYNLFFNYIMKDGVFIVKRKLVRVYKKCF